MGDKMGDKMKKALALFLALALSVCAAFSAFAESAPAEGLSLLALNVGKADCLLLFSGNDVYMIDTGRAETADTVISALASRGIGRLKGVIVTHTDKDHAGGLHALAGSGIKTDNIYASAYYDCDETDHPAKIAAEETGAEVRFLKAGDTLPLEGGEMRVLGPLVRDPDDEDNNSLVIRAQTRDGSILLTGDMKEPAEEILLDKGVILRADVLKVGHHGKGDATSEAFLNAVRPKAAVISTGSEDNKDKPSKKVLARLLKNGVQTASTHNSAEGVLITLRGGVPTVRTV